MQKVYKSVTATIVPVMLSSF